MSEIQISNEEFLLQKVKNFTMFINSNIKNEQLNKEIVQLNKINSSDVVMYIMMEIKPYENCLDDYIHMMIRKYNLNTNDFNDDVLQKFKRYLKCFIDIISQ